MKVAVAVASARVPAWQRDCIAHLRALDGIDVRVVAVPAPAWRAPAGLAARLAGPALLPVDVALEEGGVGDAAMVVDLCGGVAGDATAGVWSFRLGESDDATLPFTREIVRGAPTFRIELLRRAGAEYACARAGCFGVMTLYPIGLRVALGEAARWPAIYAAALRDGVSIAAEAYEPSAPAPAPALPRVVVALAEKVATAVFDQLTEVVEWNVGFVHGGPPALLGDAPLDIQWLPAPEPMTFVADPFVAERDGVRALFVEEFDYARSRGVLEALTLDEHDDVVSRTRILDLPTHLSYPYPLEIDGELYLLPESCAVDEAALYRCVRFPDRWEREAVALPFDAVDTTIFPHEGRWWAFCTRFSRGSTLALHAFHASSPRGPWTAHALNPVVVDVGSARPAGTPFVLGGVLYRPGQDCVRAYGDAVTIARVDELTPTAYRETIVRRLDGRGFGRYAAGAHTVSVCGNTVVVDGKRVYRTLRKTLWAGQRLFGRFRRRSARREAVAPEPRLNAKRAPR
jgi:hypothetical protein